VVLATLRKYDRIALAERRRRNVITNLSFGSGCRCCYDPDCDGGEYDLLAEARQSKSGSHAAQLNDKGDEDNDGKTMGHTTNSSENSDDSSEDSEFDYLLDEDIPGAEDEGLVQYQQDRILELQVNALAHESAVQHGFGVHRQIHPTRVLKVAGLDVPPRIRNYSIPGKSAAIPPGVVLHLYDPLEPMSASLDLCLEQLAEQKYKGTKFMRSHGRSTLLVNSSDLLTQIFRPVPNIATDLPALVAIKDGIVKAMSPKLSGLGVVSNGEVEPRAVEEWLDHAGVLLRDVPLEYEDLCKIRPEEDALLENMMREKARMDELNEQNAENIYQCGVPGCQKLFQHEHVGVKNEEQSGLVVSENEATGISK
jgi:hypothetical protein